MRHLNKSVGKHKLGPRRQRFGLIMRQVICSLLIACLLGVSTPAAIETAVTSGTTIYRNSLLSFKLVDWSILTSLFNRQRGQKRSLQDRLAQVAKIEINASGERFIIGKRIPLYATALDQYEKPVGGVNFDWEITDPNGNPIEIDNNVFSSDIPGVYAVTVRSGAVSATGTFELFDFAAFSELSPDKKPEESNLIPYFDEWMVDNIHHARRMRNLRGNVPAKPKGKTNFAISAPVLSIPGRGLNVDLGLHYNSQVWSKLDQDVSYDMDKDVLSPGWSMGFGKIINIINGGIVQVDPDGTRRYFPGTINGGGDRITYVGQSVDGKFIKSRTTTSVSPTGDCFYNPTTYLKYPDGTTVWFDVFEYRGCYTISEPITMVPKLIQDRHGNQIEISYHNPVNNPPGRWINQIRDTLGRTFTFNYVLDNNRYYLSSISGQGLPDQNQQIVTRTFVRLQYKNHTVSHNFSGLTPHVRENNIKVLSAIYYPSTQSGYWFGDADSYSPYGMIRKVDEHRAMSYSSGTGISAGQLTRRRVYSYPENTTTAISDVPTFDTVTESWEGMVTPPSGTEYQVNWDANPRTTTTIASDGTRVTEYSFNLSTLADTNPDKIRDGLTYKTEVYDSSGQLRSRNEVEWELGYQINSCAGQPSGCVEAKVPRPKKIIESEIENGITLSKTTVNDYGQSGEYNQPLETKEYGYGGEPNDLLHRTVRGFTKKGDSPTTGEDWELRPRLIGLPTTTEIFDGTTNARIGYTKNEYDLNPLLSFSGANPTNFCITFFCNSITEKGNLSATTSYSDAATPGGEFRDNREYDKAGNMVLHKPEITANTLNKYVFSIDNEYAYPEEIITASDDPNLPAFKIQSSAVYDFNTGLTLSATDADNQEVAYTYDPEKWRLDTTQLPTGGSTTVGYDDINRIYSQSAFTGPSQAAGKQRSMTNGLGLVSRKETFVGVVGGQDVWDVVEIEYDQLGRVKRTSNPFRSNESAHGVYWSEVFYDGIGRPWKTVAADGSEKFEYYNETSRPQNASSEAGRTLRVKDPVGREKWHRTDIDGNVVEVIEPAPDGNGSVASNGLRTEYTYDKLKRLIETEQGAQFRRFRYDSLGRLISQKMAETANSLDSSGVFVGDGNGQWSDFYVYDKFSNITSYTDARGVTTTYSYQNPALPQFPIDPLNRVFSVSYNTNSAPDVLPAPGVSYTYETSGNLTKVRSVSTSGVSTVELDYDSLGRMNEKKTTLSTRPNFPITINYVYDSLNRVTDIIYPTQYGAGGSRKNVQYDFDAAGRIDGLSVDASSYASNFNFNNFGQISSVKIGPSGTNQITETYAYNPLSGLLENQKVLKSGTALLDLSYQYQQCSCSTGGGGQVTKITNNLDANRNRSYDYDALGRLRKVTGGINKSWSQEYSYDRYGNRTNVTALGVEALRGEGQGNVPLPEVIRPDSGKQTSETNDSPNPNTRLSPVSDLRLVNGKKSKAQSPQELIQRGSIYGVSSKSGPEELKNSPDKEISPETQSQGSNYVPFDFDNDEKADVSVFQRPTGAWVVSQSGNGQPNSTNFGLNGDQVAPGDYDGDGIEDRAVWRPSDGVWHLLQSTAGYGALQFGQSGDSIVPADYDGDGKTDMAVWRSSTGTWWIFQSSNLQVVGANFGAGHLGDIPVQADFDGDGKTDIAVWRPSEGNWYLLQSTQGYAVVGWGVAGDVPVQADYDGDGRADVAIWRPSTGAWWIFQSSNGQVLTPTLGSAQSGDITVPADYDGDGKTDVAVWRPSDGNWHIQRSSLGFITVQWGSSGNIPVPSAYRRRSSAPKNQSMAIPRDGHETLAFNNASNRITTSGFTYDLAGNQTRIVQPDGGVKRFQYDAAGRLVKIKADSGKTLTTHTYGASRERLITQDGDETSTSFTYYAWDGEAVISEFVEGLSSNLVWSKNYVFMGGALLATHTKTDTGEKTEFAHSDRLGTRVVTDQASGTHFEQATLPFGTALNSESSGATNRRFTSYDRSVSTGLDYAINRFYDSAQGRFTQVDPIKMASSRLIDPQTLNLYSYTANDPVNRVDPDGKFWGWIGAIFGFLAAFFRNTNFNFNFNFRGLPLSFGFQGHFRNIYVGVAGFTVQVTGRDSVFKMFGQSAAGNQSVSGTLTEEQINEIRDDAVMSAINKLTGACGDFVSGSYKAVDVLRELKKSGYIYAMPSKAQRSWVNGQELRAWGFARTAVTWGYINLYRDFFYGTNTHFGQSVKDARILTILHEIGHVTRAYRHAASERSKWFENKADPTFREVLSDTEVNAEIFKRCF